MGSRTRSFAGCLATVLAAAALAGCGGADEEAAPSTESATTPTAEVSRPTKREFIVQGDALCGEVQAEAGGLARRAQELEAQSDELSRSDFLAQAAAFWGDQLRVLERFRERFVALGVPAGHEAQIEQFIETIDDGIAAAREIKRTLERSEPVPQELSASYARAVDAGNTLARGYGFEVCGRQKP